MPANDRNKKMTIDTRYNGWTNYSTWRVYMEIFDALYEEGQYDGWDGIAVDITPERLREIANEILDMGGSEHSTTLAFARAFIAGVNWHEISEHLNDRLKLEVA